MVNKEDDDIDVDDLSMLDDDDDDGEPIHAQANRECRATARRKIGPLIFGWGLLGSTVLVSYVQAHPEVLTDLTGPGDDPNRTAKMLHWLAHCGMGDEA